MLVCPTCGSQEFELNGECWSFGCCLPLGVPNGWEDGFPGQYAWRLEPSGAPLPPALRGPGNPPERVRCADGHNVFEAAVAVALTTDRRICGLSLGLRCRDDGLLHLYINNARALPTGTVTAAFPANT